ncbi:MAG: transcriptional regulator [Spirulina sp.]
MKTVKTPTTKSYQSYLIESLKDPEEAAGYLEALFEEENPEPELLHKVLSNILEALGEIYLTPEQIENHRQKLNYLLSEEGSFSIYHLSNWLEVLGLKIRIQPIPKPSNY